MSLSTGTVAGASVNCDNAIAIGLLAASKMDGKIFTDIKLCHKDKVVTIGANNRTVKIRGLNTEVNATLLFNRITCFINSGSDMQGYLAFELMPQPPSLFHDGVMRKPAKSSLAHLLHSFITHQFNVPENSFFVLDGGHLLQTVIWPNSSTYASIQSVLGLHIDALWCRINSGF